MKPTIKKYNELCNSIGVTIEQATGKAFKRFKTTVWQRIWQTQYFGYGRFYLDYQNSLVLLLK